MKKYLVLIVLFVLPLVAYLFFASGINNFTIILPAFIFGICLGILAFFLENVGSPYAYNKFKNLKKTIKPIVFLISDISDISEI